MTILDLDIISLLIVSSAAIATAIYVPLRIKHDTEEMYHKFQSDFAHHIQQEWQEWLKLVS